MMETLCWAGDLRLHLGQLRVGREISKDEGTCQVDTQWSVPTVTFEIEGGQNICRHVLASTNTTHCDAPDLASRRFGVLLACIQVRIRDT